MKKVVLHTIVMQGSGSTPPVPHGTASVKCIQGHYNQGDLAVMLNQRGNTLLTKQPVWDAGLSVNIVERILSGVKNCLLDLHRKIAS